MVMGQIIKSYHFAQGTYQWYQAHCGMLTASRIARLLTVKGKRADNEAVRALINEMAFQRLTGCSDYIPETFAMVREHDDKDEAREIYSREIARLSLMGFMTRDFDGVTLGYSPDGLVGDDGLIEIKSRTQKFQLGTIINVTVPDEYKTQIQAGLMISGRSWCDFISFPACGGGKMLVMRTEADEACQARLMEAVLETEAKINAQMALYKDALKSRKARFFETKRHAYAALDEVRCLTL